MNNKTPSYLKDKLPPKHGPFLVNVFRRIKCRTDRYLNSFLPHAITSWNIFISHFDDFPSVDSLKEHLLSLLRPKNKRFYGIHVPRCLRYLFQLRLCLSSLRSHKFHQNFIDTPSDICYCNQGIEDTRHFLLLRTFYVTQRANLLTSIHEILQKNNINHFGNQLKLFLYGHDSINCVEIYKGNSSFLDLKLVFPGVIWVWTGGCETQPFFDFVIFYSICICVLY